MPRGPIEPAELYVKDGLLHRRVGGQAARIDDADFLLLEIERQDARADWESLSSISKPLQKAQEYLDGGDDANAEAFFKAAIIATRQTSDLTGGDKKRVVSDILSRMPGAAAPQTDGGGQPEVVTRSLFDDAGRAGANSGGGADPYSPEAVGT